MEPREFDMSDIEQAMETERKVGIRLALAKLRERAEGIADGIRGETRVGLLGVEALALRRAADAIERELLEDTD